MFRERSPALLAVPFRNYYWANPFDALGEAITKILLGLPVGVLLTLFRDRRARGPAVPSLFSAIALFGRRTFRNGRAWAGVPAVTVSGRHGCAAGHPG